MSAGLAAPFFEIGPKNLLRRAQLESIARDAGAAGVEFGVTVVLTAPTALIAPLAELGTGMLVFAQEMDAGVPGPSFGSVIAESLVDAGAAGVMLNHDSNPLDDDTLARAVERAHSVGLQTIVVAGSTADAVRFAALAPTAILFEPPELIGTVGAAPRGWIAEANAAVRELHSDVLMMHAGGVGTPEIARSIMVAGADGTGSTSGVLTAADPVQAARQFIAATRAGWDASQSSSAPPPSMNHHSEGERP